MSNNDKMSIREWLSKAEWEGGLYGALDYGLGYSDLSDEAKQHDFAKTIQQAERLHAEFRSLESAYNNISDEYLDSDEENAGGF